MAKNNKTGKSAAEAAAQQQFAPNTEKKTEEQGTVELGNVVKMMQSNSLSQDGKAITANLIQKRWVENDKTSPELREAGNFLVDSMLGDIIVTSFVEGSNLFAFIVEKDEQKYLSIKAGLSTMGINLPDLKALPSPTEEQLKKHGVNLLPAQAGIVQIEAKDVSKDAIAKKKEEIRIAEKAVENPADIKNDEQLKASLTAMLIKPVEGKDLANKPDPRIQRTINFYNGYLTIKANAAENKEEALKSVKEKSRIQMLNEISDIVGPCPFALSGISKFLRNRANETGTIISPYTFYRRCAIQKDSEVDDQYLADIVRVLLIWSCNSQIAENEALIKTQEKTVKNEKGNAKVATETAIRVRKSQIEEMKNIIEMVNNPSFDVVDNLIDNYKSADEKSTEYQLAHRIVDDIMKTYYPECDKKNLDEDVMLKNVQQRAGVVINMFRDPLSQSISYVESNLTEMVEAEASSEKKDDEKKETPKN